jgi:hypothetical protein
VRQTIHIKELFLKTIKVLGLESLTLLLTTGVNILENTTPPPPWGEISADVIFTGKNMIRGREKVGKWKIKRMKEERKGKKEKIRENKK